MGNGTRIGLAALAGLGLFGGIVLAVPRMTAPELAVAPAPVPATPVPAAPALAPEAPPAVAVAPSFDTVRVAPDGSGLVAGRAEPGSTVAVVAGGEVAVEAEADGSGRFVAFLDLPPSAQPRELTLRGGAGTAAESVILAPTPGTAVASQGSAEDAAAPDGAGTAIADVAPLGEASQARPDEAPGQALVLLSDASGVRVIQPATTPDAGAEVLSNVAIDAIGYDGSGEVRLSGRGAAGGAGGGSVRVYLDNEPVAEAAIAADGTWTSSLAGTAPGVYTLRVDEIDANGEVLSRIETPFQREERHALAAAMADASGASTPGQSIAVRTVQPGNTLWAIARDRYDEPMMYVQVFELNRDRIRDPDLIYPGQVFVLPTADGL